VHPCPLYAGIEVATVAKYTNERDTKQVEEQVQDYLQRNEIFAIPEHSAKIAHSLALHVPADYVHKDVYAGIITTTPFTKLAYILSYATVPTGNNNYALIVAFGAVTITDMSALASYMQQMHLQKQMQIKK
jgi:hypothetical protein